MIKLLLISIILLLISGYEIGIKQTAEANKHELDSTAFQSYQQGYKDGLNARLLVETGEIECVNDRWVVDSINFLNQ